MRNYKFEIFYKSNKNQCINKGKIPIFPNKNFILQFLKNKNQNLKISEKLTNRKFSNNPNINSPLTSTKIDNNNNPYPVIIFETINLFDQSNNINNNFNINKVDNLSTIKSQSVSKIRNLNSNRIIRDNNYRETNNTYFVVKNKTKFN